jgi:hypothetical protein
MAPTTKAPAKKAVAVKTVKKAPVKAAARAPVKRAATKTVAPRAVKVAAAVTPRKRAPRTTKPSTISVGADMLAELIAERVPVTVPSPEPAPPAVVPTRPRSTRTIAIAAIVAAALLLSTGAAFALTRSHAPSKAAFIAKAEEICRPANGPVSAIVKPTSYPELQTAAGTVVTTTTGQLTQLRALKRPGGADGRAVAPVFTALEATNDAAHQLQDGATRKDDNATISNTKQITTQSSAASTSAKSYGFTACASGLQTGIDTVVAGSNAVLKTGFVAKADSLCRASARMSDAIPEPGANLPALVSYASQNLDIFNKLVSDLKALPVPPADEATVTDMIGAGETVNAKVGELRDAAAAKDIGRLTAADKELSTLTTAADAKFDAYGLGVCGSNFGNA